MSREGDLHDMVEVQLNAYERENRVISILETMAPNCNLQTAYTYLSETSRRFLHNGQSQHFEVAKQHCN